MIARAVAGVAVIAILAVGFAAGMFYARTETLGERIARECREVVTARIEADGVDAGRLHAELGRRLGHKLSPLRHSTGARSGERRNTATRSRLSRLKNSGRASTTVS